MRSTGRQVSRTRFLAGRARSVLQCLVAIALLGLQGYAQDIGQTLPGPPVSTYGRASKQFLKTKRTRVVVTNVDMENREVGVSTAPGQGFRVALIGSDPLEWSQLTEARLVFIQPSGMEKLTATKSAARAAGKKGLLLEDLTVGSRLRIDFYPMHREDALGRVGIESARVEYYVSPTGK